MFGVLRLLLMCSWWLLGFSGWLLGLGCFRWLLNLYVSRVVARVYLAVARGLLGYFDWLFDC